MPALHFRGIEMAKAKGKKAGRGQRGKGTKRTAQSKERAEKKQQRTLGDIRQDLEGWIDEHVVIDINDSDFPELVNLYSYTKGAFLRAVEIVKGCIAGLDVIRFVQIYTDLDIFLNRETELDRDEPGLIKSWPENRGLTFSKNAFYGCSARNIATKYSIAVMDTVTNARAETLGTNRQVWTKIVVSPEPDSRILMWRDLAVQEIIDRIIPPGWEMYEINGEHGKIDDIMNGEFEKAIKEAEKKDEDVSLADFIMSDTTCKNEADIPSVIAAINRIKRFEVNNPNFPEFPKPTKKSIGNRAAKFKRKDLRKVWSAYRNHEKYGDPIPFLK